MAGSITFIAITTAKFKFENNMVSIPKPNLNHNTSQWRKYQKRKELILVHMSNNHTTKRLISRLVNKSGLD